MHLQKWSSFSLENYSALKMEKDHRPLKNTLTPPKNPLNSVFEAKVIGIHCLSFLISLVLSSIKYKHLIRILDNHETT